MELVLVPRAHDELAIEATFAERPADVIADVRDDAELAVLVRDCDEPLAEFGFREWLATEIVRRADVYPFPGLVHGLLPMFGGPP
jgi:hypothetical protein